MQTAAATARFQILADGARIYALGNTYPLRDRLRAIGAHWDAARRAWWVGAAKRADLEALATAPASSATAPATPLAPESLAADAPVRGRARYRGASYLLVWEGETRRGPAAKLATRDGARVFWASAAEVVVEKRYSPRSDRWGRERYPTRESLDRFASEMKSGVRDPNTGLRPGQRYECEECGEFVTAGQGSCWETGCAH